MFSITPKQAKAIAKIASDDTRRPSLNGALYTPKGAMTGKPAPVATDGARLVEVPVCGDLEVPDVEGIIPTAVLESADGKPYAFMGVNGEVTVTTKAGTVKAEKVEGPYPDYARAIPAEDKRAPVARIRINAGYLLEIAKALNPESRENLVTLTFHGDEKAILVECMGTEAKAVLMPVRIV